MNDHTHTDKTLQGNNKIESAIAALQQEPSQEMLAHTLTVIRRRMNEHGELIIAIDPSSAASGLQVQAIQTDDGRKWWAAFTSFDEELKGSGSVMSTFLTDMKQLFNSAITTDNIQGIISTQLESELVSALSECEHDKLFVNPLEYMKSQFEFADLTKYKKYIEIINRQVILIPTRHS